MGPISTNGTINYPGEIIFRVVISILFSILESTPPFIRTIHPEEIWLYRYPKVKTPFLEDFGGIGLKYLLSPFSIVLYPFLAIFIGWIYTRKTTEAYQTCLIPTLSLPLTGAIINFLKIAVGRPRPNFMNRCYGSSYYLKYSDVSQPCTGDERVVLDGRKSFPSGHSGLAFASFGFIILYVAEKGQVVWTDESNRWKIFATFVPLLLLPTLVAIARTCDYKHHWQDVLVGSLIGCMVTYFVFQMYSPAYIKQQSDANNANRA